MKKLPFLLLLLLVVSCVNVIHLDKEDELDSKSLNDSVPEQPKDTGSFEGFIKDWERM